MHKSLIHVDLFLRSAFKFCLKHAVIIVVLTSALFAFLCYQTKNLTQSVTIEDQLDPSMQSSKDLTLLKESFGSNTSLGLLILPGNKSYFSNVELCSLQEKINTTVRSTNIVSDFISPFKLRYALPSETTLSYERVLPNPCSQTVQLKNPLEALTATPWKTLLTDISARDLTFNFTLYPKDPPGFYGDFDAEGIEHFMNEVEAYLPHQFFWSGPLAMQHYTLKGLAQSQWLNFILIIIIWLSLRFYFGTWRGGAIFLGSLFFTSAVIFGGMAIFHHPMDMLSSCLFLILSVSSLEDYIFVAQHQLDKKEGFELSHLELITPSFFTSITTIIGLGSLMMSDLLPIKRFGMWAAIGATTEWIAVFLLVPAFMKCFPSWQKWVDEKKAFSLAKTQKVVKRKPSLLFARFALIVFIFSFFSIKNFRLSQTPSEMFPKNHPYQKMVDYVRGNRGWEAEASLYFDHNVPEEKRLSVIEFVSKDKSVTKIENQRQAFQFITEKVSDPLARKMVYSEFENSKFAERYFSSARDERAILYLKTTNTQILNELRASVELQCPSHECWVGGEIIAFADFSRSVIHTLFDSFFVSLLLVGLVITYLAWANKKPFYFSLVIASFWGPAVILCLIYAFDLSINFVTCIIASTLVGLTGDNAIQFIFAAKDGALEKGIQERGPSSLYCALTMGLCSLVFLGSYFEAPKVLGVLLAAGFFFSLIGDVWILNGLTPKKSE